LNHFDVQLQLARNSPHIQREKIANWKQKNKTSTNKTQPFIKTPHLSNNNNTS
jgi:hypothetical protein